MSPAGRVCHFAGVCTDTGPPPVHRYSEFENYYIGAMRAAYNGPAAHRAGAGAGRAHA